MELSVSVNSDAVFGLSAFYCVTVLGSGVQIRALDDLHLLVSFQNVGANFEQLLCWSHGVVCLAKGGAELCFLSVADEKILRFRPKNSISLLLGLEKSQRMCCLQEANVMTLMSADLNVEKELVLASPIKWFAKDECEELVAVLTHDDLQLYSMTPDLKLGGRFAHNMAFPKGIFVSFISLLDRLFHLLRRGFCLQAFVVWTYFLVFFFSHS